MADETKKFIIETIYNSVGMQNYITDLQRAKTVSKEFGINLSSQATILESTVTRSFKQIRKSFRS